MPVVSRDLSIVYGGHTVGGSTDDLIDGKITISKDYNIGRVSAEVVITDTNSDSSFNTRCNDIEEAFRTPRQRLQVKLGAQTLIDWNPSTNSGFNARPNIMKIGSEVDTGRTRRYTIEVEVDLPADLAGQSFRRDSTVQISYTPSRVRSLLISGTYTASNDSATNDAETQYMDAIGTYATALIHGLGGEFELVDENYDYDDTNKILNFTRMYEEIIFDDTTSTTNDPEIVKLTFDVSDTRLGADDSPLFSQEVNKLATLEGNFSCWVDKDQTTDLESVWENKVRDRLLDRASTLGDMVSYALMRENVSYDRKQNRIFGSIMIQGITASTLISALVTVSVSDQTGAILIPVWEGSRYAKHLVYGPARRIRTTTVSTRRYGGGRNILTFGHQIKPFTKNEDNNRLTFFGVRNRDLHKGFPEFVDQGLRGPENNWVLIGITRETTPGQQGIPPNVLNFVEETVTVTEEWVELTSQSVSSGRPETGSFVKQAVTGAGQTRERGGMQNTAGNQF